MEFLKPLYSKNKSEADIQADLYCALKALGLDPRLEVRGYVEDRFRQNGRRKCIFDIAVFWPLNHKPLCIIECKKGRSVCALSTQKARYQQFGLPLLYCFKHNSKQVILEVKALADRNWNDAPPSMKRNAEWNRYLEALDGVE